MITLDTNVIIRFFEQDDLTQHGLAHQLIESLSPENKGFIPRECIIEMAWVLTHRYHYSRKRLGRVIRALVACKELLVENSRRVTWAAYYCEREGYDFSDLMVLGAARDIDAVPVKTFDTQFSRHHQVSLLRTH